MLGLAVVIALTVMRPRHQQPQHLRLGVGPRKEPMEGGLPSGAVRVRGNPRADSRPPARPMTRAAGDEETAELDRGSSQDLHTAGIPSEGIDWFVKRKD